MQDSRAPRKKNVGDWEIMLGGGTRLDFHGQLCFDGEWLLVLSDDAERRVLFACSGRSNPIALPKR